MVEKAHRAMIGNYPRDASEQEWEVFIREGRDEPLRHVGSITAPDNEMAHEQASRLFAWYATDVWVCPVDAIARYSTHDLDRNAKPVNSDADESRAHEDLSDI